MYTDSPSVDALEVKLENGQIIYLQKVEYDRIECYIIDTINQLHTIQGSAMVGDIISSYLDVISDQLHHPEEMEHQVAIIYYIIDTNTRPGGKLKATANTVEHDRPERRQVSLADSV